MSSMGRCILLAPDPPIVLWQIVQMPVQGIWELELMQN
jgi:hypothetical protein